MNVIGDISLLLEQFDANGTGENLKDKVIVENMAFFSQQKIIIC